MFVRTLAEIQVYTEPVHHSVHLKEFYIEQIQQPEQRSASWEVPEQPEPQKDNQQSHLIHKL